MNVFSLPKNFLTNSKAKKQLFALSQSDVHILHAQFYSNEGEILEFSELMFQDEMFMQII